MSDIDEIRHLASKLPIINSLPTNELSNLLPKLFIVKVAAGKFLAKKNNPKENIYFIVDGRVKICRTDENGKEVIIALLKPGNLVGEISTLTHAPKVADVVTLLPCTLLALSAEDFLTHIDLHTGLGQKIMKVLALKVYNASHRISDLALYDVCRRTIRILLSLSDFNFPDLEGIPVVNPRPTHQSLASMVGASREVVSRALKSLEKDGHLSIEEDLLIINSVP